MNRMQASHAMVAVNHDESLVIGDFPPTALKFWQRNQRSADIRGVFLFLEAHVDQDVLFVFRTPLVIVADADLFHLLKTLDCGGTEFVNQTLPPMMEPWPTMVSPPRMVEFE